MIEWNLIISFSFEDDHAIINRSFCFNHVNCLFSQNYLANELNDNLAQGRRFARVYHFSSQTISPQIKLFISFVGGRRCQRRLARYNPEILEYSSCRRKQRQRRDVARGATERSHEKRKFILWQVVSLT